MFRYHLDCFFRFEPGAYHFHFHCHKWRVPLFHLIAVLGKPSPQRRWTTHKERKEMLFDSKFMLKIKILKGSRNKTLAKVAKEVYRRNQNLSRNPQLTRLVLILFHLCYLDRRTSVRDKEWRPDGPVGAEIVRLALE